MGGDLEKIRIVGYYLMEVWKAAGMNLQNVVFKWASEEITNCASTYWPMMMDIARRFTITRIKKCCQIMGRLENNLSAAQVLYPIMQCTDIFFLKADICQLGVDQRKVNMLAREYCDYAKRKHKPIILSHHMLYGLKQGQEKMSKSDPDSAIFMEDSVEDVHRKIMNAYCPSTVTATETTTTSDVVAATEEVDAGKVSMHLTTDNLKNPILDYIEHIIFSAVHVDDTTMSVSFPVKDVEYTSFQSVKDAFLNGTISESELKLALINKINVLLDPVRHHFSNDANAKHLFQQVQQFKKESSTSTTSKVLRKCNLQDHNKVPKQSHVVLAPLPNLQPTLQEAMDVLTQLRQGDSDKPIVLYLQDWTAFVSNACAADTKGIMAYYTILLTSLKALDPTFMETSVTILYQSETILSSDPSNYWISVINVGRFFMLHQVMGQNDMVDSDNVGKVIGRLMTVADIVSIDPFSIALSSKKSAATESTLIEQYYTEALHPTYGLVIPKITMIDCLSLRLQPVRESDALITENDEIYLMDDPKVRCCWNLSDLTCLPH
jgi:tyrosyl-tRNA synthetase